MKAVAVFPASKQISIVDHEPPALSGPTQAKLRMLEVGICGTDREICRFDYGIPPAGQDHLIIGHESLGEVVETGSFVSRVKQGDLVVTFIDLLKEATVPIVLYRPASAATDLGLYGSSHVGILGGIIKGTNVEKILTTVPPWAAPPTP